MAISHSILHFILSVTGSKLNKLKYYKLLFHYPENIVYLTPVDRDRRRALYSSLNGHMFQPSLFSFWMYLQLHTASTMIYFLIWICIPFGSLCSTNFPLACPDLQPNVDASVTKYRKNVGWRAIFSVHHKVLKMAFGERKCSWSCPEKFI